MLAAWTVLVHGATAATHIVNAQGTGDFPTIQAALDAAVAGDSILLVEGVYRGAGNRDLRYGGKGILLRSLGGDPEGCVLDCEEQGRGIVFDGGEGRDAVLEGVTILGGRADLGGGLLCAAGAAPTVRHCILRGCRADSLGGALAANGADLLFEDCLFRDNRGEQGGGAAHIEACSGTLLRCGFYENEGVLLGGAMSLRQSSPLINGCTFAGNVTAGRSGALDFDDGSSSMVYKCTFVHNVPAGDGAAVTAAGGSAPVLENSILAFAVAGAAAHCIDPGSSFTLFCTDIFGNPGGDWTGCLAGWLPNTNFNADPLFCGGQNPSAPYTLHSDSPCAPIQTIDCGEIGAWPVACGVSADVPWSTRTADWSLRVTSPSALRTRIVFVPPAGVASGLVHVSIHDASGRVVRSLACQPVVGSVELNWDGRDDRGRLLPGGLYHVRLGAPGRVAAAPVVRLPR